MAAKWAYTNAAGQTVAYVVRWSYEGGKEFRPFVRRKEGVICTDPDGLWPLYRLHEIAAYPDAVVHVGEGEKKSDALAALGLIATCSAHGANSASKTDWSPLAGRRVDLHPDHDEPGEKYIAEVAAILQRLDPPALVKIVRFPGLGDGEDAVEFVEHRRAAGLDDAQIRDAVEFVEHRRAAGLDDAQIRSEIEQLGEAELLLARDVDAKTQTVETGPRVTTLGNAARDYLDSIRGGQSPLIETGIGDLDYSLGGGVERGELIIFAARPSHGKSAVALQCIHHWTSKGMPCAIVSEEMAATALGKRTVQFLSPAPQEHWQGLAEQLDSEIDAYVRSHAPCIVLEGCGDAATAVEAIETAIIRDKVECVVVDYAQLLRGTGRTRYEQMSNVSVTLRQLASKHKIVLLALCQMSRDIESRQSFNPTMSDLKETGQFEQDADVIVFLCWPWRLNQSERQSHYQFFVEKNRNRPINQRVVDCSFDPARQTVSLPPVQCPVTGQQSPVYGEIPD